MLPVEQIDYVVLEAVDGGYRIDSRHLDDRPAAEKRMMAIGNAYVEAVYPGRTLQQTMPRGTRIVQTQEV